MQPIRAFQLTDPSAKGPVRHFNQWLACAVQLGYLAHSEFEEMKAALSEVGRLLTRLISKPGLFCQRGRDEAPAA